MSIISKASVSTESIACLHIFFHPSVQSGLMTVEGQALLADTLVVDTLCKSFCQRSVDKGKLWLALPETNPRFYLRVPILKT
ncbi:hypothetical protein H6F76_11825 [Leptolyngbya sp. FACHB-321]|uniref:hypothetical protein n=1 Tax=Leptolyngbya sp. FACHB-321 TaxID=2692807 RepID=UPI0016826037|nr:hypothetical protein [Leptolyngbya sp. FACHB-321]MBD2035708.1 hypothetical protein [Leptolyngbya sp. FACHB-321]